MKYIDEFRDAQLAQKILGKILKTYKGSYNIMEICGGQTHTLLRFGLDEVLSSVVNLIHGPGCPVCVTPQEHIDMAIDLALTENVILATYGDMLRVPGSNLDLLKAKAMGGDVRMVYSPIDAIKLAMKNPEKEIVFFAIGFETTAPPNAVSILNAEKLGLENYSLLCSHVLVPPAIKFILEDPESKIHGFIAPGHVCTVSGYEDYEDLANSFKVPFVVAGFEPIDLLYGVDLLLDMIAKKNFGVKNAYKRSVKKGGNPHAKRIINQVFEVTDTKWRGIGTIPKSGLKLKEVYSKFDAVRKFHLKENSKKDDSQCIAGEILQGKKKPMDCPLFRTVCTPTNPLGAPMVSSEGACNAYFRFKEFSHV